MIDTLRCFAEISCTHPQHSPQACHHCAQHGFSMLSMQQQQQPVGWLWLRSYTMTIMRQ